MSGELVHVAAYAYQYTGHVSAERFRSVADYFYVVTSGKPWGPFSADELADMPSARPVALAALPALARGWSDR